MRHQYRAANGTIHSVEATEPVPGLRVYRLPEALRVDMGYNADLAHHSGKVIAAFERLDEAEEAAHSIADLTDWTRDADTLRADAAELVPELLERIVYASRGVLIPAKPDQHVAAQQTTP